jgi:hypothetical protein
MRKHRGASHPSGSSAAAGPAVAARIDPGARSAEAVLALQRAAGNRAVTEWLGARRRVARSTDGWSMLTDAGSFLWDTGASLLAGAATGAGAGATTCALTTYTGSNFVGKPVVADVEFVDSLDAINAHAVAADVNLHVTSSFRKTAVVPGAIVTPAKMSNHMAGHAIDMNVLHGPDKKSWCNSTCLAGSKRPAAVEAFIQAVRADAGLRWGGDFNDADPVHIDDNLNADAAAWKARRDATQAARTSGCG